MDVNKWSQFIESHHNNEDDTLMCCSIVILNSWIRDNMRENILQPVPFVFTQHMLMWALSLYGRDHINRLFKKNRLEINDEYKTNK